MGSNEEEFNFLDELSFACNNFDTDSPKHRKIGADAGMVAEDSGNDEPRSSPKSSPKSTKSEEPSTPQQGQDGNESSTTNKPGPASKRGHLVDSEASTEVEDDQGYKSTKKETAIKTKKETKIEVKDVSGILKGLDEEDHEVTDVSTDTDDKSKSLKDKDIDRPKQSIKKDKNWLKETNETSAKIRPGPMSKKMQAKPWL